MSDRIEPPTICVYAIFRDEEANVAGWADTTVDADRRFVLDTGSTDNTLDALDHNDIDYYPATFDPFRFDDARNCALALAPAADLYLRLDADERLCPDWRRQIDAAYHPMFPRYRYRVRNVGGIWGQIVRDDLHQRHGFRWKYPTHEVLVGPAAMADLPDLVVTHTSPPDRRPHHLTNLDVLYQAVVEYPDDHRMRFYYARECWYAGHWERCRDAMVRFLALDGGWEAERAEAYRILAAIDIDPERWLWKAVGESPERREPWVDLARLYQRQGRIDEAQAAVELAARRVDDSVYTTDPTCWGEPFNQLRAAVLG